MQFTTAILSTITLFMATKTMGAAIETEGNNKVARAAMIATSPYYACNCPNNCSYKSGTGCRFYSGPSSNSDILSGKCYYIGSSLSCIAT